MAEQAMRADLSERHAPLTDLFPRAAPPWEAFRLGPEPLARFERDGYATGVRVLDGRQLAALRQEVDALTEADAGVRALLYEYNRNESDDRSRRLIHCLGHWRVSPALHDLLWHPALTVPASQLLRGPVRFWHDQLFLKPAREGGVVAWHQDYSYWTRTRPLAHVTAWIALDDATQKNGCVHFVPGSQRWPLLPKPRLAGDMDAIRSVMDAAQRAAFAPVPNPLPAGFASFHHPLLVHGSYPNESPFPRRGVVVNYIRDGVVSDSDGPLLEGVPAIPRGRPLGGRFFPLLLDASV
jgi:ectoine hydroxylase-related dioxygenase (phytanoyl-CoA dioxygenase family)